MAKKRDLIETIEAQRNVIECFRAENERLRGILRRNGINVDTKLPDWMEQKQNVIWTKKREPDDPIAIWEIL